MKRVGVREIASAAGVSIGTVDRALNGRKEVNAQTRDRILEIARKLGYEPNAAARALSGRRPAIRIGVCIPREIDYRPVKTLQSDQRRTLRKLLNSGLNGLFVTPGEPAAIAPIIDEAEGSLLNHGGHGGARRENTKQGRTGAGWLAGSSVACGGGTEAGALANRLLQRAALERI